MKFNIERVRLLEKYHQDDPGDPFTIYALAMEWSKKDLRKSRDYFDILLDKHEDYLPAYYQAADLCVVMNLVDKARDIYEKGISVARKQGDLKTLSELQTAYDAIVEDDG